MGTLLSFTAALVLWIVLWALGAKAIDGFLLVALIMVVAASARVIAPYLPGNRPD